MWRWRFNEKRDTRNYARMVQAARQGGDAARVIELQGQLEQSIAMYREGYDADLTERLVRRAQARRIPIPGQDGWLNPTHGTRKRLTDAAIHDLRGKLRGDAQSFWHLPLNWLTLIFSLIAIAISIATYLKPGA